jgi:hypothetical protein
LALIAAAMSAFGTRGTCERTQLLSTKNVIFFSIPELVLGAGEAMRRREFIILVGGAVGWPLAARAQEPGRIYRLGDLRLSPRNAPWNTALFEAVKSDGFIDGQNLTRR